MPTRLTTHGPVPLYFSRLKSEPSLAPGAVVVGTFVNNKLIARQAITQNEWERMVPMFAKATEGMIVYDGDEDEGGNVEAHVSVLLPSRLFPRQPWEEAQPPHAGSLLLVGIVRRARSLRVAPDDLMAELQHHFGTLLTRGTT